MLSINQIDFSYADQLILDNLSLRLEPEKIHGILGPNGSGKTTLLHILGGRLAPDSGTVSWNGQPLIHPHIAYLETKPYFYPMITGREYLNLFTRQNPNFSIEKWNELFVLPIDQLIETYSSGMKKKLALMGVISLDRPIMLLDEPFNNLDVEANQFVAKVLQLLAEKGKLILLTSHILEILTAMTYYIHVLGEGQIMETVPKDAFMSWKNNYRADEINAQINKAKDLL